MTIKGILEEANKFDCGDLFRDNFLTIIKSGCSNILNKLKINKETELDHSHIDTIKINILDCILIKDVVGDKDERYYKYLRELLESFCDLILFYMYLG